MKNLLRLFTLAIFITACQVDEVDTSDITPIYIPPAGELVHSTVKGHVVQPNGEGIEGAVVNYNGNTISTDIEGNFSIEGQLDAGGTFLTVEKPGYFDGSRKFNATAANVEFVDIQLVPRQLTKQITASIGGIIALDQATVDLPAGNYRTANNTSYTGEVMVYAHYMDPTLLATFDQMPGDLTGFTTEGDIRGLVTYGMINLEMEDTNGNPLQLPEGENATLTLPVPNDLQGTAPSGIPLWYFDNDKGIWIEEGKAELVNGKYIGTVSHFTIWNCDDPFEFVTIEGVLNLNGIGVTNFNLQFTAPSLGLSGYTNTNNRGHFSIKVPKDESLTLTARGDCGSVTQDFPIGSFNMDQDIGTLNTTVTVSDFTITGTAFVCDKIVTLGLVEVTIDGSPYNVELDQNGQFNHTFTDCLGAEASVRVIDYSQGSSSDSVILPASGFHDLGYLDGCTATVINDIIISYTGQNWAQSSAQDSAALLATYIDIAGSPVGIINREVTILDWNTAITAGGNFIFEEGDTNATYVLLLPQGFYVRGTCSLVTEPYFLVTGNSTDITITDTSLYPGNVDNVFFYIKID